MGPWRDAGLPIVPGRSSTRTTRLPRNETDPGQAVTPMRAAAAFGVGAGILATIEAPLNTPAPDGP